MEIYYENHQKEVIDMTSFPVGIEDVMDLFKRDWDFSKSENILKNSTRIERFYRTSYEKKVNIQIFADDEEEFTYWMNRLMEVTEIDIIEKQPGRLYCNGYYLECYITEITPSEYEELYYSIDNAAKIYAPFPFWIKESEYRFGKFSDISNDNKKYKGKYKHRYPNGLGTAYLINNNFYRSNVKINIYGPVINPQIFIGQNKYLVNINLEEGERLEIDTRKETILKIKREGDIENVFHYREKGVAFFTPIEPGRNEIKWTGKFDFDVTTYEERSSPKW